MFPQNNWKNHKETERNKERREEGKKGRRKDRKKERKKGRKKGRKKTDPRRTPDLGSRASAIHVHARRAVRPVDAHGGVDQLVRIHKLAILGTRMCYALTSTPKLVNLGARICC